MRIYAEREMFSNRIALHLAADDGEGRMAVAQPVVMAEIEDGARNAPCLRLTTNEAQSLMDELWHAGIRPSEGNGSAGAMAATVRHLEDMRKLVFSGVAATVNTDTARL